MSTSGYVVVPAESADPNQILGRVSFFNDDGTPWTPEAAAPTGLTIADIEGLQEALDGKADA